MLDESTLRSRHRQVDAQGVGKRSRGGHRCLFGPARTCSRWWHDYAAKGDVLFLRGRLRFGDGENSAPFPSALVVFCNDILPKRYIKQCVICDDLFAAERTHAKVCSNRCRVRQHRQQQ